MLRADLLEGRAGEWLGAIAAELATRRRLGLDGARRNPRRTDRSVRGDAAGTARVHAEGGGGDAIVGAAIVEGRETARL